MHEFGLFSPTTIRSFCPTYYGSKGGTSMIDHVALPLYWIEQITCASPIHRLGRRLQVIKCAEPRDHIPVLVKVRVPHVSIAHQRAVELRPDGRPIEQVQWDRDRLMQAIRGGPLREQFMRSVEPLLEQEWPNIEHACLDPNIVLDRLDRILRTAGAAVFKKGPAAGSTRSALAQRRLDLLARRRDLRSKLGQGLSSEEYVACCEELTRLTKQ
eukprot:7454169-Pyramimonas_sp.AAC.1